MRIIIFLMLCILLSNIAHAEVINYGFEKEWPSRVSKINGLTQDLEEEFKFGAEVLKEKSFFVKRSTKDGFYYIEERVNESVYNAFLEWKSLENFNDYPSYINEIIYYDFVIALSEYNISIINKSSRDQYLEILNILSLMPEKLVNNNPDFTTIKFGGNIGKNQAKISEYREETHSINIFDFLLKSPKRLFTAIFIHEIGHVVDETFLKNNLESRNKLMNAKTAINNANATYTFDFGMSREGRISYQHISGEFIAENFMHYVLQGDDLRQHIMLQKNDSVKSAWCEVYNFYKNTVFNGTEFSSKNLINTTIV